MSSEPGYIYSLLGWLVRIVVSLWRSTVGWFVWKKNIVSARNLRSFTISHSQTNRHIDSFAFNFSKYKVLCILFGFNFQFPNLRLPWWEMRFGTEQNASRWAIPHCAGNINMASVSSVLVAWISIFWAAWARCPQKVESRKSGARVSEATLRPVLDWG